MSEVSTYLSGSPMRPAPARTMGYPQDGRRVAVLGPDGVPVARGEAGVLAVDARDPGVMLGYLGDAAATAARFAGGWFVTGDMAVMQGDGAIRSLGRADDMMNAGGFRVSPAEVEATFAAMARGEAYNFPVVREALGEGRQYGFKSGLDRAGGVRRTKANCLRLCLAGLSRLPVPGGARSDDGPLTQTPPMPPRRMVSRRTVSRAPPHRGPARCPRHGAGLRLGRNRVHPLRLVSDL